MSFHNLLLIRNKPCYFFVVVSLKLSAHTLAHNFRATRKSFEGFKWLQYLFINWSREENLDSRKNVVVKGIRIERESVLNFW